MKFFSGNKLRFAIEIETTIFGRFPLGKVIVWLDSLYIGSREDDTPIFNFISGIKRILDLDTQDNRLLCGSSDEILRLIQDGFIEGGDNFRLALGESFDDFFIVGFRSDAELTIIWSINENTFFSYPNYPKGSHRANINVDEFIHTLREFEAYFQKMLRLS